MADFNYVNTEQVSTSRAASSPTESVRLKEHQEDLSGKADVDHTHQNDHAAVTSLPGKTVAITVSEGQAISAEVIPSTGLKITDAGLAADIGTSSNQVAAGDHTHVNDHVPATADENQTDSAVVTVGDGQKISADVKLSVDGGLKIVSGSGIAADVGTGTNQVAAGDHTHDLLMTSEERQKLKDLTQVSAPLQSVSSTESIGISVDENGSVSATVKTSTGIKIGTNGVEADFDLIAAKNHSHENATSQTSGFMSSEDKAKLDSIPEGGSEVSLSISDNNKTIDAAIIGKVLSAEVKPSDNGGLKITDAGLAADIGTSSNQVAAGDHTHDLLHNPASGGTVNETTDVSVDDDQNVSVEVKIASGGGLMKVTDATAQSYLDELEYRNPDEYDAVVSQTPRGIAVDFGTRGDQASPGNHVHDVATKDKNGFMSSADKVNLDALTNQDNAISSVGDTDTLSLSIDKNSKKLTGDVIPGNGLTSGENGLEIDKAVVSLVSHTHPDATDTTSGFMSPTIKKSIDDQLSSMSEVVDSIADNILSSDDKADFKTLQTALEKQEFARGFIPVLRSEVLNTGDISDGVFPGPASIPSRSVIVNGVSTKTFTIKIHITGVTELKNVWNPSNVIDGTRAILNGTPFVTSGPHDPSDPEAEAEEASERPIDQIIEDDTENWFTGGVKQEITQDKVCAWVLEVSNPAAKYYLNSATTTAEKIGLPVAVLDYIMELEVQGGAEVSLSMVARGTQKYSAAYNGYFLQIDPTEIEGVGSITDISEGKSGSILEDKESADGTDGLDGSSSTNSYPALNLGSGVPGYNSTETTDATGVPSGAGNSSSANQPIIDINRDLLRLSGIQDGGANGRIDDILINGDDIWISGAFTRFGNKQCPGLARLDSFGRYAWDFNSIGSGFTERIRNIALASDGGILAASILPGRYQNSNPLHVHKMKRDGTEDTTFLCPKIVSTDGGGHPNIVIGMAALTDGSIGVLTPRTLTVLNSDGSVFSRNDTSNDMFISLLAVEDQLLLSSHALSGVDEPQRYGALKKPKGLKLLSKGSASYDLDSRWAQSNTAGTGAMASCGRAITDSNKTYFIAGNGLTRYGGIDTSWNCQLLGNLILSSEDETVQSISDTISAWNRYGSISVSLDTVSYPTGVDGCSNSSVLTDTDSITQAYLSQSITVEPNASYVFSFYLKKQDATTFPVVQLNFGDDCVAYAYINTNTGEFQLKDVTGNGTPEINVQSAGDWWLVSFSMENSSSINNILILSIFPAYSTLIGGSSASNQGSIQIAAPSLRLDYWTDTYVPTTTTVQVPSSATSNKDRFQGLYKILANGAADPDFNCVLTYSSDDGMAIPFAIDSKERIYFGGPVSSIKKSDGTYQTVTPWMLYRITNDGYFDKSFENFNDDVTCARINSDGNIIVAGKFTQFGSKSVGRIVFMTPTGEPVFDYCDITNPVIVSSTTPDVAENPGMKNKIWVDTSTDPYSLKVWSESTNSWVCSGTDGLATTAAVVISPQVDPGVFPVTITLTSTTPGAVIHYTIDGSDPRVAANNPLTYSAPITLTAPGKIFAYASKDGWLNSVVTSKIYGPTLAAPVITPDSGNQSFPVSVTITAASGATILYTTDGTNPATSSTVITYTGKFTVGTASDTIATVRAIARETGYFDSDEAQASYGDNILPDLIITPSGSATVPVAVTFSLPDTVATPYSIVYNATTDGTTPEDPTDDTNATSASGPLTLQITTPTQIKAVAKKSNYSSSPVASAAFGLQVSTPVITDPTSSFPFIIVTCSMANAVIHYKLNGGSEKTATNPASIDLRDQASTTIEAWAVLDGYSDSEHVTGGPYDIFQAESLTNIDFSPSVCKSGGAALSFNPFTDIWNTILNHNDFDYSGETLDLTKLVSSDFDASSGKYDSEATYLPGYLSGEYYSYLGANTHPATKTYFTITSAGSFLVLYTGSTEATKITCTGPGYLLWDGDSYAFSTALLFGYTSAYQTTDGNDSENKIPLHVQLTHDTFATALTDSVDDIGKFVIVTTGGTIHFMSKGVITSLLAIVGKALVWKGVTLGWGQVEAPSTVDESIAIVTQDLVQNRLIGDRTTLSGAFKLYPDNSFFGNKFVEILDSGDNAYRNAMQISSILGGVNGPIAKIQISVKKAGFYDLLVYGHGPLATNNSSFTIDIDGTELGTKSTLAEPVALSTNWQDGVQYVSFKGLECKDSSVITIIVNSTTINGILSIGWINAIQLLCTDEGVRMEMPSILPESGDNLPISACGIINNDLTGAGILRYTVTSGDNRLTSDGDPDETSSVYSDPFVISDDTNGKTVKAIATMPGRADSAIAMAYYKKQAIPKAPTIAIALNNNNVPVISWDAVDRASSYNIKRSTTSGSEVTMANITSLSYVDTTAVAGTTYYYVVSAINATGESANSNEANIQPEILTTILSYNNISSEYLELTWKTTSGAESYNIYYGQTSGVYTAIETVYALDYETESKNLTVSYAKLYPYVIVRAVVGGVEGPASNELHFVF